MTHQLLTPTGKKLLLITDLPEGCHDCWIHMNVVCCRGKVGWAEVYNHGSIYEQSQIVDSLQATAKIIGLLSEVKEFDEYVEKKKLNSGLGDRYFDYGREYDYVYISSKDSFLSLLRREGLVLEEPVKPKMPDDLPMDIPEKDEYDYRYRIYQQQLSKYINPSRTLLIEVKS